MEEMLSQLIKSQDAIIRSQDATAKSLEAKMSALTQSHTSTDDKLSHIAYKQIEQIAEMSDLVDQRALPSSFDHPLVTDPGEVQNGQIVQSTTADSCSLTQKPTLGDETESKFI